MRSGAARAPPYPLWLCLATWSTYNFHHYGNSHCKCSSKAVSTFIIGNTWHRWPEYAAKNKWSSPSPPAFPGNSLESSFLEKERKLDVICYSRRTQNNHCLDTVLQYLNCCFQLRWQVNRCNIRMLSWLFSVLLHVSWMTNWLFSHSRLNNNNANVQASARIILVNGIFNYTETVSTANH